MYAWEFSAHLGVISFFWGTFYIVESYVLAYTLILVLIDTQLGSTTDFSDLKKVQV